jgi:hypothetical protein
MTEIASEARALAEQWKSSFAGDGLSRMALAAGLAVALEKFGERQKEAGRAEAEVEFDKKLDALADADQKMMREMQARMEGAEVMVRVLQEGRAEAMAWRPIEEAPKDGATVLLYIPKSAVQEIVMGYWSVADDADETDSDGWYQWTGTDESFAIDMPVTHYAALATPAQVSPASEKP